MNRAPEFRGKRIGVLMGGSSAEREISLKSGEACLKALEQKGYLAVAIDVDQRLPQVLRKERIQVAFIALHGPLGEDGTVQGLLEVMRIPYTGSGVTASALAMDKVQTKRVMAAEGIPTPEYRVLVVPTLSGTGAPLCDPFFQPPLVVKPSAQGSTIGVTVVRGPGELTDALEVAYRYGPRVIVEKFIDGQEIAAAILDGEALPLVEIRPRLGHYDYEAKYTAGYSHYRVPAQVSDAVAHLVEGYATGLYRSLGCSGVARVDLRVDMEGRPFLFELNTIPGMTETSLVPMAARARGLEFSDLVERMLWGATLKV